MTHIFRTEGIIIYVNINVKMIFNTVGVLFYLVFILPYHVATDSTQFYQIFLMNTVVFFVLINFFVINNVSHSTHTCNMINILMLSCKTWNTKYSPITEYNIYSIHEKECSLSTAEQPQSMSVTDIFDLTGKCKIPQLVEDAAPHVIRTKKLRSSLTNKSIEFKTEGPR